MDNNITGIYMIKCNANNNIYIGSTIDIKRRWMEHKKCLRGNYHRNNKLQEDWNKYGEDKFEFSIIQKCTEEELDELEIKYISEYENTYNLTKGGKGNLGWNPTEETRKKMGEKNIGRIPSAEKKRKQSEKMSGKNNPFYGKHHTEETKKKLSTMVIGILPSGYITEPMSQTDLAKLVGIERHTIARLRKTGKPYKSKLERFKYLDDLIVIKAK